MRSNSNRHRSQSSRLNLRRLLASIASLGKDTTDPKRGRLLLESLEQRQMLAGDIELLFTDGDDSPADNPAAQSTAAQSNSTLVSTRVAEGELAPDLVQFAKALDSAGVQFFGAHWCPACTAQKELFADGKNDLPFIEVTDSQRQLNQIGIDEGITEFPTWVFPDDSRLVGVQSLATLSARSGVPIPQSEQPTFEPIGATTVRVGSPLHIPIDAYDPDGSDANGGPLTVTVSVENPALLEATVLSGNRSIRIDMQGYGDMVFELFEQRAPRATGRVIDLAQSNPKFYDGIIFHRIVDNFVIQGGDPTGTGSGGSSLGDFDDDFHPDLQHNRPGVLSFAKSNDDTNDSQFFITEVPTRFLDFNHSVFGQLVEGEDVREAISFTSTPESRGTGTSQRPDIDVVIDTIEVFNDTENSVIMLKAASTAVGSTNVTVTVTDEDGNSSSETFAVTVAADTSNSQPFLTEIPTPAVTPNDTSATLQLSSIDVEGDPVTYFAQSLSSASSGTVSVDATTGLVTVNPAPGFEGTINVGVGVRPGPGVIGNSSNDFDSQTVPFTFVAGALVTPTSIDLQPGSDTGSSNIDNITRAGSLTFTVDGVTSGASVELVIGSTGSVIGTGFATGNSVTITTDNFPALGDGTYQIAARQRNSSNTSGLSPSLTLVYDTTAPASVVASASNLANVGRPYQTNLINSEEGSGLRYAFSSAPSGATIDATTGVINWTPLASQAGSNTFSLELTDLAGNVRAESFDVQVADAPLVAIKLVLTDLQGTQINSIAVGQQFLMQFIGVDTREFSFDRDGVFAAFADILFDSSLVRPVPGSAIDYDDRFPAVQKGTFSSGLIDELGAVTDRLTASELEESLIATVRFEALAAGTVNIRSEPADAEDSEVLLYGNDNQIPASSVEYRSATLAIGQSFTVGDDTFTVQEDSGATVLDVLNNDVVVSGSSTLSVIAVTQPASGATVTLESGVVRFTPNDNFNGDVEFTYTVSDTNGVQETANVMVTVTPVDDPPTAVADTFSVEQNSTNNSLDVLANDSSDPDGGETLTVTAVSVLSSGVNVSVAADGRSVIYTPPTGFTGTETFSYTVSDGTSTSGAVVNVTVAPSDNPPTAVGDAFNIIEDDAEDEFDVLGNDLPDTDGQSFVINSVGVPNQGGSARISNDGSQFFYAPAANFNGTERVTYTIRDTGGGLSVGTVTFTVAAVNDPPPATDLTVSLNRGGGEAAALSLADLPANVDDGETLTFANLGTPTAGGTVRIDSATNTVFYTPPSVDFTGTDSFTYDVEDGSGLTSSGTITIDVSDFVERNVVLNFSSTAVTNNRVGGIRLTGTNALGSAVDVPLTYGANNVAQFTGLLPGEYTIEIPAIPFLQKATTARQISLTSAATDGDMTIDADLGRLRPEFVSIRDWLGSAPQKSLLVAVTPGETGIFSIPSSNASDNINDAEVELDSSGANLTIRGTDSTGAAVEATLPTTSDFRVQPRGQSGEMRLLRVSVHENDVTFTAPAASSSSSAAEGESIASLIQSSSAPVAAELADSLSTPILLGQRQAEGETATAAAVTRADIFVPVAREIDSRTDATVISLESGELWVGQSLTNSEAENVADGSNSIDIAMNEVAPQLVPMDSLNSLAEANSTSDEKLDETAIDAVLTSNLS